MSPRVLNLAGSSVATVILLMDSLIALVRPAGNSDHSSRLLEPDRGMSRSSASTSEVKGSCSKSPPRSPVGLDGVDRNGGTDIYSSGLGGASKTVGKGESESISMSKRNR